MSNDARLGDPFAAEGDWYRGNLHTHSTNSDGDKSVEDAVGWYRDHGYHFMSLTDHRMVSDTSALASAGFLTIPGVEMHGPDPWTGVRYHLVGLGALSFRESSEDWSLQEAIDRVNQDSGVAILGHPYWLGQSAADMRELHGFVGMEVYNSVCQRDRAKGFSSVHWDDYCNACGLTWGFATDDTHWRHDEAGGGWVMVRTADFSVSGLLAALRAGGFYATMGPEFHDVRLTDGKLVVRCSPVRRISVMAARWNGKSFNAPAGETLDRIEHQLGGDERYVRVEIEDATGRQAWTNPWPV
jgi:hypothetical protein